MDFKLIFAIITITSALVFYTTGVFSERKDGVLKAKHLYLFALGLIFDITGTTTMSFIAREKHSTGIGLHKVTGVIAILLMAFHLIWGIYVYKKGLEKAKENFHKFSIVVWAIWLIPYIAGMFLGMSN